MGKHDIRTRRGKIIRGSYGLSRPKHKDAPIPVTAKKETKAPAKPAKKPAAPKATATKAATKAATSTDA